MRAIGRKIRVLFLAALPSLPVIAWMEPDNGEVIMACALACTLAGVVLKSWPILGMLLGIAGAFLFLPAGSGPIGSSEWHFLEWLGIWAILGFSLGFAINALKNVQSLPSSERRY